MAKKNILANLSKIDKSYLLDPSVVEQDNEINLQNSAKADTTIEIDKLVPFKNHPFHVDVEADSFQQLVESIEENGVIVPIMVRPIEGEEDKYEIIAGHCRVEACKKLGIEEIPAKIQAMDDLLATVIMTHSNISGRDRISVSEKAKAYRMCMDQEKHQGINKGEETATVIGAGKDSTRQVYRFVRLSYLLPEFLDLIDSGRLAVQIAYEIAFISEEGQKALYKFYSEFHQLPDLEKAKELREKDTDREISYEQIVGALVKPPSQKSVTKISFKTRDLTEYFEEDTDPEEMQDIMVKLLVGYKEGKFEV